MNTINPISASCYYELWLRQVDNQDEVATDEISRFTCIYRYNNAYDKCCYRALSDGLTVQIQKRTLDDTDFWTSIAVSQDLWDAFTQKYHLGNPYALVTAASGAMDTWGRLVRDYGLPPECWSYFDKEFPFSREIWQVACRFAAKGQITMGPFA